MKSLLALFLLASCVGAAPEAPKKAQGTQMEEGFKKETTEVKEPNSLDKKPEDCDDKAKKPVEITPDSISLSGTSGCSLDEAHP